MMILSCLLSLVITLDILIAMEESEFCYYCPTCGKRYSGLVLEVVVKSTWHQIKGCELGNGMC